MAWQLSTPVAVGDLDSSAYQQVKIIEQRHSGRGFILVDLEYGNTVDNVWVPGVAPKGKQTSVMIDGEDYNTLVTTSTPNEGETTYDAVKRGLYTYLVGKTIIGAGSVV